MANYAVVVFEADKDDALGDDETVEIVSASWLTNVRNTL